MAEKKIIKKKKKVARYEYWFVIVDNNNKFCNATANTSYLINSREKVDRMNKDLAVVMRGNIKAVADFRMLRKFFVTEEEAAKEQTV